MLEDDEPAEARPGGGQGGATWANQARPAPALSRFPITTWTHSLVGTTAQHRLKWHARGATGKTICPAAGRALNPMAARLLSSGRQGHGGQGHGGQGHGGQG